jgi:S-methylmethionine-dependent homocysteine/selenocysteine methylase
MQQKQQKGSTGSLQQTWAELLENPQKVLLLDGGTGEEIFRRHHVPDDRKIWSATALVHSEYHSILEQVHSSFLQSGSTFITTNSYGVVPGVGFNEEEITTYLHIAGKIARQAATKYSAVWNNDTEQPIYILGSLGPLVESYRPDLILPHDEGTQCYRRACQALAPYVDAYLGETLSSVKESFQILDAVAELDTNHRLPLLLSYTLDSDGNFRDGQDILVGIQNVLNQAKSKHPNVSCTSELRTMGCTLSQYVIEFIMLLIFGPNPAFCFCVFSTSHSIQLL